MKEFMEWDFCINAVTIALLVRAGTGHKSHRNRPSHGLVFNTFGNKSYSFLDGKSVDVGQNEVIYLPKGSNYDVKSDVLGDCYAINFELSDDVNFPPFAVKIKNHAAMQEHFRTASKEWFSKRPGYMAKCKAELYSVIALMQYEFSLGYLPKTKLELIQPAVELIQNDYLDSQLGIEKLAEVCGITPVYFRKIFKINFGQSPRAYINSLRISKAKELLESGMYTVTDAAILSGFTDMSHFSRAFKKSIGIPPSENIKKST